VPADFRRRYGRYWADRTFWINTTLSSDVPDLAGRRARLFEVNPGISADGVLFADPHRVAALLKSDSSITARGLWSANHYPPNCQTTRTRVFMRTRRRMLSATATMRSWRSVSPRSKRSLQAA
jgi:hypothetical protein